jgi:hypothetical protein
MRAAASILSSTSSTGWRTEPQPNRQGRLAAYLIRMDLVVLNELDLDKLAAIEPPRGFGRD